MNHLSFKGGKLSSKPLAHYPVPEDLSTLQIAPLSMRDCTVCTSDRTYQFSSFELQQAYAKVSLNATGSSSAINHFTHYYHSKQLTDIILNITEQVFFQKMVIYLRALVCVMMSRAIFTLCHSKGVNLAVKPLAHSSCP